MKKLIALVSMVAITLSFSVCVLADESAVTNYKGAGVFETEVSGVGEQATILVVKGSALSIDGTENNIEYINQESTGTGVKFTYQLRDGVVKGDSYTIFVGGSTHQGSALSQTLVPEPSSANYKISGTISNVARPLDYSELWDAADPEAFAATVDEFWKTKVTLIPYDTLNLLIKNHMDDSMLPGGSGSYVETVVSSAVADSVTGEFTLNVDKLPDGVESAHYALVVRRPGYLAFFKNIDFRNENILLENSITIIPGDVEGNVNFDIGGTDIRTVFDNLHYYGDGEVYKPGLDFNADADVNGTDLRAVFDNSGKGYDVEYVLDGINLDDLLYS